MLEREFEIVRTASAGLAPQLSYLMTFHSQAAFWGLAVAFGLASRDELERAQAVMGDMWTRPDEPVTIEPLDVDKLIRASAPRQYWLRFPSEIDRVQ